MVLPDSSYAEEYPALSSYLHQMAATYSSSEMVRKLIVEITITRAADNPELLFAIPIDNALSLILSDVAQCELGLSADGGAKEIDPMGKGPEAA